MHKIMARCGWHRGHWVNDKYLDKNKGAVYNRALIAASMQLCVYLLVFSHIDFYLLTDSPRLLTN